MKLILLWSTTIFMDVTIHTISLSVSKAWDRELPSSFIVVIEMETRHLDIQWSIFIFGAQKIWQAGWSIERACLKVLCVLEYDIRIYRGQTKWMNAAWNQRCASRAASIEDWYVVHGALPNSGPNVLVIDWDDWRERLFIFSLACSLKTRHLDLMQIWWWSCPPPWSWPLSEH